MQTTVGIFQWTAYHSSSNFHEHDSFASEHWLPGATPEFSKYNREVVQPFSTGPRNCIGKKYVTQEVPLKDDSSFS